MPVRPELCNNFKKAILQGQGVFVLKIMCAQNYSMSIRMDVRSHWGKETGRQKVHASTV